MLTFEFSNPYYEIKYKDMCIGTIRHDLGSCRLLSPIHFIQIANKLNEIDASLRAQRWFKW